jgi:hypothetical protein
MQPAPAAVVASPTERADNLDEDDGEPNDAEAEDCPLNGGPTLPYEEWVPIVTAAAWADDGLPLWSYGGVGCG